MLPVFLDCSGDDSEIQHEKGVENGNRTYPALPSNIRSFTCAQREALGNLAEEGNTSGVSWLSHKIWKIACYKICALLQPFLTSTPLNSIGFWNCLQTSIKYISVPSCFFFFFIESPRIFYPKEHIALKKEVDLQLISLWLLCSDAQRKPIRACGKSDLGRGSSSSATDSHRCP